MPPEPHPRSPMFVADAAALGALVDRLRGEPIIALDTESNSFHVYRERVCLLQVSTRTGDFVVDPLAVDPAPLGEILCDGRETVLHGADYDVRCLRREYGWRLPRLFDTMAAARRLGRAGLGLSALVEGQFGVRLSKTFQRADWGRRPLTREQLTYAALATHYLLAIHTVLSAERAAPPRRRGSSSTGSPRRYSASACSTSRAGAGGRAPATSTRPAARSCARS